MKKLKDILQEDCWKGYKQYGMKEKDGKQVPNCVPVDEQYITEDILDNLKNKFSKEKILQSLKDLKSKVAIEGAETKEAFDLLMSGLQGNTLSDEDKKKISEQLKDLLKAVGLGAIAVLPGGAIVMALLKLFKLQNFILPSAFKTPVAEQLQESESEYKPYMYSPVGFSCKVCKFIEYNKDEARWVCSNDDYQKYAGTHYLLDENKKPIKDPSKWCSNWFKPNT